MGMMILKLIGIGFVGICTMFLIFLVLNGIALGLCEFEKRFVKGKVKVFFGWTFKILGWCFFILGLILVSLLLGAIILTKLGVI